MTLDNNTRFKFWICCQKPQHFNLSENFNFKKVGKQTEALTL